MDLSSDPVSFFTRKRAALFVVVVFIGALIMLDNLDVVSQTTFVDDNNLHSGQIFTSSGNETYLGIKDYALFLQQPEEKRDDVIKLTMSRLGFEVHDYHDKYNSHGITAVLRPRRTDDRNCILLMGRYSQNNSSPLNSNVTNMLNTLGTLFSIAEKLSLQEFLGRNYMFLFLDDSTHIGVNDFFNEYQQQPLCGRIISGFEFDIQPMVAGPTKISLVVGTYPFMSNQDMVNSYIKNIERIFSNTVEISITSKYVNSSIEQMLLHSSLIRYCDSVEGPLHNTDMLLIQTQSNITQLKYSFRNVDFITSTTSLLKSFNNLYQQLQYSTYFYILLDTKHYINFSVSIILTILFALSVISGLLLSIFPQLVYYVFKPKDQVTNELIIVSDLHLSDKLEISNITTLKIWGLFITFSIISFVFYLYLFGWNIISIEDTIRFNQFTLPQQIYLISMAILPICISIVFSKCCRQSLAQLRILDGLSGLPSMCILSLMIFANQPLAIVLAICIGASSIIPFISLHWRPSLYKLGKISSLLFSVGPVFYLIYYFYKDVSILFCVPTIASIIILTYIPITMAHVYVMFAFENYLSDLKKQQDSLLKKIN
ncbi:hypothetical protein EHI8A_050060 [Entamoeba histolytica HM-1:IMSS-B]|uniref:Uncharacterized protein n=4 Tax=Entamoeba histolytica TaxID=5759 RepID=C4M9R2_ENTH1|nr:hypothetical protein EHI_196400 [Entamoeba histolytica HM-1:IMSS]EAL44083.1 hypothetical protein EHI_196400 [Entamoeba histolytica HM-1:IMSS]EMH77401.1 hypothetical protein EHI8A_050060 [Entamoeba histolytica HM-1:IMSS-B]ENY62057.1 hypothetical protein EHI7A_049890 [Entamoeba histolytica HM-1:IMSS-A]GAT98442.1 hypothetical protein CL6EHI_196400 [Entamoeba histolytica]|eukprot:XP_649469.1 hypothetical protein EHI_196400 [Entamoeba histolytica HM-1:IMSS]